MGRALIFQSDFGTSDGAVCAMYGVAHSVDSSIRIFDLTHDIPQFNIWEGSYRLLQSVGYWPNESVFVSVVDPGVGSDRRSICAKTASGHFIITPDNGTLTHLKRKVGIVEARIIDETLNRLPFSGESHTFHGRDIFAFTGARLASGRITFEQLGDRVDPGTVVEMPCSDPYVDKGAVHGTIEILDVRFGNLWTNISRPLFTRLEIGCGDKVEITIKYNGLTIYENSMIFGRSFADTLEGQPLIYVNSLDHMGVALNQKSFAKEYGIGTGGSWSISIRKA